VIQKTAVTPEIQISIIAEQKYVEPLHLFKVFIKSVTIFIQDVLQTSSKQKVLINGINLV
jgi:hypothetical protein